jgi:hypothetical protein
MATVIDVYYRRAAFCCAFLWAKRFNAKDIQKEMFLVYGEKCFRIKLFITRCKRLVDDEEVEMEMRKWLRRQSKEFTLPVSMHW